MGVLRLNEAFAKPFVTDEALESIKTEVLSAYDTLAGREGAGSDFLGWVDLPENYDKEEFARILTAAENHAAVGAVFQILLQKISLGRT